MQKKTVFSVFFFQIGTFFQMVMVGEFVCLAILLVPFLGWLSEPFKG